MYTRDDEADYRLRREYCLLENARHHAREEYLRTGHTPTLEEMLANGEEPGKRDGRMGEGETGSTGRTESGAAEMAGTEAAAEAGAGAANGKQPTANGRPDLSSMKRDLDGYGREIFVEKEEKNGQRMVWYQRDKYGKLYRKTRRFTSIVYDLIEEPPQDEV